MSAGRNIQTDHLKITYKHLSLIRAQWREFKKWADQKRKRIISQNQFKSPTDLHKYNKKGQI